MDVQRKITSLLYPGITVDLSRGINSRVIYGENSAPSPKSRMNSKHNQPTTASKSKDSFFSLHSPPTNMISPYSIHKVPFFFTSIPWLIVVKPLDWRAAWCENQDLVMYRFYMMTHGHINHLAFFTKQAPIPIPYPHQPNKTLTSKPKITSQRHNENICLSNNVSTINCIGSKWRRCEGLLVTWGLGPLREWPVLVLKEEWQKHRQDAGPLEGTGGDHLKLGENEVLR